MFKLSEKDATEDFDEIGHSDSAKDMMEKYYIGDFNKGTIPVIKSTPPPRARAARRQADTGAAAGTSSKIIQFLIPLLILALGFAFRYFKKED